MAFRLRLPRWPGRSLAGPGTRTDRDWDSSAFVTVPLSALPADLEYGSPTGALWRPSAEVGGVEVPALELAVGAPVIFRLQLPERSRLRSRVAAGPGQMVAGGLRMSVELTSDDGRLLGSWNREVEAPSGTWTDFTEPLVSTHGSTVQLLLSVAPAGQGDAGSIHGLWGDPVLDLPLTALPRLDTMPRPALRPRAECGGGARTPPDAPLISVLMPVHDPDPRFLEEAIASIRGQTFSDWELCLADDGSADERVRQILGRHTAEDGRILLTRLEPAQGIAGATNAALSLATGHYIALVDHDDVLARDGLAAVAEVIGEDPGLALIYSDEDLITAEGQRLDTSYKPDWSPDLFRAVMYTGHLGVYRRKLVTELGGFRPEFDGSQDYDLVLRLIDGIDRVAHIPQILYSWRVHEKSAASGMQAKPHAYVAARKALAEHLVRIGVDATVEDGPVPGWYRIRYRIDPWPRVALLIPVDEEPRGANARAFIASARSWAMDVHRGLDVFLAGSSSVLRECARLVANADLDADRVRFCNVESTSHWAVRLAAAVSDTDADYLALWRCPLASLDYDWLRQMVGLASHPGVGVAGTYVRDPNDRVEQGAVVFGDGWPLPVKRGSVEWISPVPVQNFRAVNDAVMIGRHLFDKLGGLDPALGDLALVDLCLRAGHHGLRVALSGIVFKRLVHRAPEVANPALTAAFRERWSALGADPYYNPNFWQGNGDFIPLEG